MTEHAPLSTDEVTALLAKYPPTDPKAVAVLGGLLVSVHADLAALKGRFEEMLKGAHMLALEVQAMRAAPAETPAEAAPAPAAEPTNGKSKKAPAAAPRPPGPKTTPITAQDVADAARAEAEANAAMDAAIRAAEAEKASKA